MTRTASMIVCLALLAGPGCGLTEDSSRSQGRQTGVDRDDAGPAPSPEPGRDAASPEPDAGTPDPCEREPGCTPSGCDGTNCPCDVVAQDCAAPTDRCYPGGVTAAEGQCYPAGGQGAGAACVEPPVDTPEACGAGLLCVYESEAATAGTCLTICGSGRPCPTGASCHALDLGDVQTSDYGVCVTDPPPPPPPPCDPFVPSCDAGEMCVLAMPPPPTTCVATGTGAAGTACLQPTDCAPGSQCAGLAGASPEASYFSIDPVFLSRGGGTCMILCRPGDDAGCGAGHVCALISGWDGAPRPEAGVCLDPNA